MYAREVLDEKYRLPYFIFMLLLWRKKKREREREREETLLLLYHAFETAKSTIVTHINIQIED